MFQTEIHIKEKLDPHWSEWFDEMQVSSDPSGETVLTGTLPDKSAVYGILSRLSSLGVTLVSFCCLEEIEKKGEGGS